MKYYLLIISILLTMCKGPESHEFNHIGKKLDSAQSSFDQYRRKSDSLDAIIIHNNIIIKEQEKQILEIRKKMKVN